MAYLFFMFCAIWVLINISWIILLYMRRMKKVFTPQEFTYQIKKTLKLNFYYFFIFGLLGVLFI